MSIITRRRFLGQSAAAGLAPVAFGTTPAFAQKANRPRLHAMIVGINDYNGRVRVRRGDGKFDSRQIPALRGCRNDARAIERAVRPIAANTHVLDQRDGPVTRALFMSTWQRLVRDASPGDTLLVTYSGHGGQEGSAQAATHTNDGVHDTFIMQTFDGSHPQLKFERLLDDEVQELWRSVQGRNTVIFVADSCHAGGMTRALDFRGAADVRYRNVPLQEADDDLAAGLPKPKAPDRLELPHVVFLPGAQHQELVPELRIDGEWQGALSVAFARAVAGAADANEDGVITGNELSSYILRSIRALSDSQQHPTVKWPNADVRFGVRPEEPLIYLRSPDPVVIQTNAGTSAPNASTSAPVVTTAASSARLLALQLLNCPDTTRAELGRTLKRARIVTQSVPADLVWDAGANQVVDGQGNIVASRIGAGDLQAVVDRTHAVNLLRGMAGAGIDMRLLMPGERAEDPPSRKSDDIHKNGTSVTLMANGVSNPRFLIFDINGNGILQVLGDNTTDRAVSGRLSFPLRVTEPFGSDYWVTLASDQDLPELFGLIRRLDDSRTKDCNALVEALERTVKSTKLRVGLQGVFTSER